MERSGVEITLLMPTLQLIPPSPMELTSCRIRPRNRIHPIRHDLCCQLFEELVCNDADTALKAALTWHNMQTLQECREACGGQGMKTENRVGQLKGEYDVQSTFEGDNNVLMQQVSKALLAEFGAVKKQNKPFKGLGLEHMNKSFPVKPSQLTSSVMRSVDFQYDILCLRERDLLHRFASEISQR